MAKLVSKTYGDALFEVALEKNQLDEFLDEVKAAQTAIEENKELFKLMSHPKIVKEEKIKIITDIFTGKVSEELVGLLRMIVDKGHFEQARNAASPAITALRRWFSAETAENFTGASTGTTTAASPSSGAASVAWSPPPLKRTAPTGR